MTPVYQTTFGEENGNCFSACVASILDLKIEEVPFFMAPGDWWGRFEEFLHPLGYWALLWEITQDWESQREDLGLHILSGNSPRGDFLHAVVASGKKIVHDPHPTGEGIVTFADITIIIKGTK